jgi:hypothetical protein
MTCTRASSWRRAGAALPRSRRLIDHRDRSPAWLLAGDDQGVLVRPDGGESAGGEGALRRALPGCGAYTQPRNGKGGRIPVLQAVPSRRDPGEVDAGAGARRDARVACAIWQAAVLLRLFACAGEAAGRHRAEAAERVGMAVGERRQLPLRKPARSTHGSMDRSSLNRRAREQIGRVPEPADRSVEDVAAADRRRSGPTTAAGRGRVHFGSIRFTSPRHPALRTYTPNRPACRDFVPICDAA